MSETELDGNLEKKPITREEFDKFRRGSLAAWYKYLREYYLSHDNISKAAYSIWENAGRPPGDEKASDHGWFGYEGDSITVEKACWNQARSALSILADWDAPTYWYFECYYEEDLRRREEKKCTPQEISEKWQKLFGIKLKVSDFMKKPEASTELPSSAIQYTGLHTTPPCIPNDWSKAKERVEKRGQTKSTKKKVRIKTVPPFVDGYGDNTEDVILLDAEPNKASLNLRGYDLDYPYAWFSESKRTLFVFSDDSSPIDKFRRIGTTENAWVCMGSGSKQKWEITEL